jgi:hypothetical protein
VAKGGKPDLCRYAMTTKQACRYLIGERLPEAERRVEASLSVDPSLDLPIRGREEHVMPSPLKTGQDLFTGIGQNQRRSVYVDNQLGHPCTK